MNRLQSLLRSELPLSLDQWVSYFAFNGHQYPFVPQYSLGQKQEEINNDFPGLIHGAYKSNGVVFACMLARQLLFSEARFQFRRLRNGRPGELFGTGALELLEEPWPGATTGDLLARAIQDVDLEGNFYATRLLDGGQRVTRLRPDWVSIVLGSQYGPDDPAWMHDAVVLGYAYKPGGRGSAYEPIGFPRERVAHFAPIPDPTFRFRGMSWLTPMIREVMADNAATTHKLQFFENGATPNLAVTMDAELTPQEFQMWVEKFSAQNEGLANAYKTLYLANGSTAQVVGADMKQIDFKVTQGAGETRIAAAAGVPPVIVGLSEGLQAATYSNYSQARRRFADGTIRPLWRNVAGSLQAIVPPPPSAELWYDDRDIPFLQEDEKDAAEIAGRQASTMSTLIQAGFTPDSVIAAIDSNNNWRLLEHTGLFSVQLQPPGSGEPDTPSANGNGNGQPTLPAATS